MSWRITFNASQNFQAGIKTSGEVETGRKITAMAPMEIRSVAGHIIRLSKGSEFSLIETPVGVRAEYFGETAIISMAQQDGKYRTSCYMARLSDHNPSVLIRPGNEPNTDEFSVFLGDIAITEYDEDNRLFHICSVCEGEKVVLAYDDTKKMRERYNAFKTQSLSKADWRYYVNTYLDGSNWR